MFAWSACPSRIRPSTMPAAALGLSSSSPLPTRKKTTAPTMTAGTIAAITSSHAGTPERFRGVSGGGAVSMVVATGLGATGSTEAGAGGSDEGVSAEVDVGSVAGVGSEADDGSGEVSGCEPSPDTGWPARGAQADPGDWSAGFGGSGLWGSCVMLRPAVQEKYGVDGGI